MKKSLKIVVMVVWGIQLCVPTFVVAAEISKNSMWEWTNPTKGLKNITPAVVNSGGSVAPVSTSTPVMQSTSSTLLINEILPDPVDGKEFVELWNFGNEDILLKGWVLFDVSGKKISLLDEVLVKGEYKVLSTIPSLNNEGDSLTLTSPTGAVIDEFTYIGADVKKGISLSKFCDEPMLHFCDQLVSQPTPGAENKKQVLDVTILPKEKEIAFGMKISFETSVPGAKIYYSTEPDSGPESMILYTKPFVLDKGGAIYYFSTLNGDSSKIMQKIYTIKNAPVVKADRGVVINEISDEEGWLEIKNWTVKPVSMALWKLTLSPSFECGEMCTDLSVFRDIKPMQKIIVPIPQGIVKKDQTYYLYDNTGALIDEVKLPAKRKAEFDKSYARVSYKDKSLAESRNTRNVLKPKDNFLWTSIPTKGDENVILTQVSDDGDHDMLTSKEEKALDTNPAKFDTNLNDIPDFFDHGVDAKDQSEWDTSKFLYKKLLSMLVHIEALVDGSAVNGITLPLSTVHFFVNEKEVGKTESDKTGSFTFDFLDFGLSGDVTYQVKVEDQLGQMSLLSEPFTLSLLKNTEHLEVVFGDVVVLKALPNPAGADDYKEEWIVLQNHSDHPIDIGELSLAINGKKVALAETVLESGVSLQIGADAFKKHLPNDNGILELFFGDVLIDQMNYSKVKDGEIVERKGITLEYSSSLTIADAKKEGQYPMIVPSEEVTEIVSDVYATLGPVPQNALIAKEKSQEPDVMFSYLFGFSSLLSGFILFRK